MQSVFSWNPCLGLSPVNSIDSVSRSTTVQKIQKWSKFTQLLVQPALFAILVPGMATRGGHTSSWFDNKQCYAVWKSESSWSQLLWYTWVLGEDSSLSYVKSKVLNSFLTTCIFCYNYNCIIKGNYWNKHDYNLERFLPIYIFINIWFWKYVPLNILSSVISPMLLLLHLPFLTSSPYLSFYVWPQHVPVLKHYSKIKDMNRSWEKTEILIWGAPEIESLGWKGTL